MYRLQYKQIVPTSLEECWDFFSDPANLKLLTPKRLSFVTTNANLHSKMYAGQIITYRLCPIWKFSCEWVTEITHVVPMKYFIDEQRFGPYSFWHHEHRFTSLEEGVEMTDTIYYKVPLGPFGRFLNYIKIEKDITDIFTYRQTQIEKLFKIPDESPKQKPL